MKAFLALGVIKSVLEKLVFIKFFAFTKSDFLNLVNFGFLNFANFVIVDKFSILPVILLEIPASPVPLAPPCTSYSLIWML